MSRYKKNYEQYETLKHWEKQIFSDWLKKKAEAFGERTVIVDGEKNITYQELFEQSHALARGLKEQGIQKNDKVAVQLPNGSEFLLALFALFHIGAIPILSLPAHRSKELVNVCKVAGAKAYITVEKYLGFRYEEMAREVQKESSVETVIIVGESDQYIKFEELFQEGKTYVEEDVDEYSTALFLLSGGTTSVPKLIPRTHADYIYNAECSAERCNMQEDTVYLAALPMAHNFPLCCPGILGCMSVGGKIVVCKNGSPDEILELIMREKVTITSMVPAVLNVWLEMLEWDDEFDISSLQIVQVGGAVLEPELGKKAFQVLGSKLMQVFGTAEGLICFTPLGASEECVIRSQGYPISEADEVHIVDEEGKEVARGEYGEMIVRGPYTIDGYYCAEEINEKTFMEEGFYRTGDRAKINEDGSIFVAGRISDQINRAGEKINPEEMEQIIIKHPKVKDVVMIPVKDELLGNRSCACVIAKQGEDICKKEVAVYLRKLGVAEYKIPDQILKVTDWPYTSVKKIDKKKLALMAKECEGTR